MKLDGVPIGAVDWRQVPTATHAGETGSAIARGCDLGGVQLRIVEYGAGYRADHWCAKGHVVHVLAGALVIEHDDGRRFALSAGMSWHAPDDFGRSSGAPRHGVLRRRPGVYAVTESSQGSCSSLFFHCCSIVPLHCFCCTAPKARSSGVAASSPTLRKWTRATTAAGACVKYFTQGLRELP
jgi:hypothetical protein